MSGLKKVEFRKQPFRSSVKFVVVYATRPVGKVIGFFEVEQIHEAPPGDLWVSYHEVGGIEKRDFEDYYSDREVGYAICVGKVWQLPKPVPLSKLRKSLTPPQSFRYLANGPFKRVRQLV